MPRSSASSGASRPEADYLSETKPGPGVRPCMSYDGGGGCHVATSDPIAEIIGDYRAFAAMQRDRLVARGIDIAPYALSHLAVRVADWDLYVHQRTLLERHARANSESVWNRRPISLIVLSESLDVLDGTPVSLIELIPPVHQRVYRMGLEHLRVVVGRDSRGAVRLEAAARTVRPLAVAAPRDGLRRHERRGHGRDSDFGGETYDDSDPLTGSDRALGLVDFSLFPHLEREDMPDTS